MDRDDGFEGAAELAGYFLAHAVWCVEGGETLVPLVGHERVVTDEGERAFALLRFEALEPRDAIRNAESWLESNPEGVARAVLIHDGYFTWLGVRHDALFCRAVDFRRPSRSCELVLPYRHARDAAGSRSIDPSSSSRPDCRKTCTRSSRRSTAASMPTRREARSGLDTWTRASSP